LACDENGVTTKEIPKRELRALLVLRLDGLRRDVDEVTTKEIPKRELRVQELFEYVGDGR